MCFGGVLHLAMHDERVCALAYAGSLRLTSVQFNLVSLLFGAQRYFLTHTFVHAPGDVAPGVVEFAFSHLSVSLLQMTIGGGLGLGLGLVQFFAQIDFAWPPAWPGGLTWHWPTVWLQA